jgi:hypothetical protein
MNLYDRNGNIIRWTSLISGTATQENDRGREGSLI